MKLLFDQDLSRHLVRALADVFPASAHVLPLGLERADDRAIWDFAAANGFTIVTKDDDFHQRSFLRGYPPKVIWLKLGNCSTKSVETALRARLDDLLAFESDPLGAFLIMASP